VELTVIERDRVTDSVIVALVVGDLDLLSVTLGVRVNGCVVGTPDLLLVIVTDRVILTDTVLDPVTDPDRVPNADAGTVYCGEGVTVRERVRVRETVGLIDLVNGCVVGTPDLVIVTDTDRVILTDTVLDPVTDPDRVPNADAGTVYGAEGLLVTERVSVSDTVGLTDSVKGRVVGIADRLTVTDTDRVANIDSGTVPRGEGDTVRERVRVSDTVGLIDRVNGCVVGTPDLLLVIVTERVILPDTLRVTVTDTDRVANIDSGTV